MRSVSFLIVLLLARLSSAQYEGVLDVNDPSCPRRHGPHLHFEWTFDRTQGRHNCFEIELPQNHYFLSMKARREGPILGAPDMFGICEKNCKNCTQLWKVAADETSDNVHVPCTETSGTKYIYIGR
ncbi:hypothetical protein P170DRAFT_431775 [Aspergillus steynii IBT 23096]|uniref:Uncharacterized protein n=1 Tax=Aspergillus steynii IBT 23096 TaxID=1392250 RepID=A0A2I2GMM4_9EURO|nr:uncharacterized protein P170DRAFT_431775 [Aspergillus steynii IBT 23096]PLB54114.1 hypothetical protein P170DRAFT_431775 [Aspergillus steynii IBT 23096]